MKLPDDVRMDAVAAGIGYGWHEPIVEELLEKLPRALIGEAINAELPEGTQLQLVIGQDGVTRVSFDFWSSTVAFTGRVVWTENGYLLDVDPPVLSVPVGRE